jgi:uncharacterized cupin superfamily protein
MADDHIHRPLLQAADVAAMGEVVIRHPLNPNSEVHLRPLGETTGMQRVRLSLARIPPGKESFAHHAHEADEEWVYILSGRGRAQIGEDTVEIGPGDVMGFPTPSLPHHLTNPYDEDLVYLMGGERSRVEVGTFPEAGKRIIFSQSGIWQVDEKDLKPMSFDDWLAKPAAPDDDE